jgi:hypothetical protein
MNLAEKILSYCKFKDDECYILLMISRKKENGEQSEASKLKNTKRYCVTTEEEVESAISEMESHSRVFNDTVFRVYISVNRRSVIKAMRAFQNKLTDLQYGLINGNRECLKTVHRLGAEWKSVLANKECRSEKKFLFDIDFRNDIIEDIQKANDFVDQIRNVATIIYFDKTKNGFALVTEPFNMKSVQLPDLVEMKSDAYLYMGVV